jgi:hypothetical protein
MRNANRIMVPISNHGSTDELSGLKKQLWRWSINASSACALAVAYLPRTRHCTVPCCNVDIGGIEPLGSVMFDTRRRLAVMLRTENKRATQSGGAVNGDSQKAAYYILSVSHPCLFVTSGRFTSFWNLAGCIRP